MDKIPEFSLPKPKNPPVEIIATPMTAEAKLAHEEAKRKLNLQSTGTPHNSPTLALEGGGLEKPLLEIGEGIFINPDVVKKMVDTMEEDFQLKNKDFVGKVRSYLKVAQKAIDGLQILLSNFEEKGAIK